MQNDGNNTGKRFVKPGEGCKPRHPELGRNISKNGEWIVDSPTLRRFLRDKDLLECDPETGEPIEESKSIEEAKTTKAKTVKGVKK